MVSYKSEVVTAVGVVVVKDAVDPYHHPSISSIDIIHPSILSIIITFPCLQKNRVPKVSPVKICPRYLDDGRTIAAMEEKIGLLLLLLLLSAYSSP